MDLTAVPVLHGLTHLPVIVDPSHATGKRRLVQPMALAGIGAGADGVMVEVHPRPDEALSDSEQQLDLPMFRSMMAVLVPIHAQLRRLREAGAGAARIAAEGGPASAATGDSTVGGRPPAGAAAPR
jgi:3-deoxy-7-phosphoheptulonate synthase